MIKIDKNKIYESHGYKFKNFVTLSREEKLMVLEWRNSESIRKVMVNKGIIAECDHFRFIEGLKERDDCYYWLVMNKTGEPAGVLDILHVDNEKDVGELGYYMNPLLTGMGLEFVVECEFFIYHIIKLGNNIATVNVNNKSALLLNTYLGDTYEGIQNIDEEQFFFNRHANGDYLIKHYTEFNIKDYLAYMREHKDIINEIKEGLNTVQFNNLTMELNDFIKNFADQFDDTDPSEIGAGTSFRDLEEWSSMIALSVLNMCENEYGVVLTFDELKTAITVQNLFDIVEKKQNNG